METTTSRPARHVDGTWVENLADILRKQAIATPDGVAVVENGNSTTYAELNARADRLAQALVADGVAPGDRVGLVVPNSVQYFEVLFGVAKAGAIAAVVSDRLSAPEVAAILADVSPRVVIGRHDGLREPVNGARRVLASDEDYQAWLDAAEPGDPAIPVAPSAPVVMQFSSGTTGKPKGILLTGRGLGFALAELQKLLDIDATSVALAPVPFSHVTGLGLALVSTLGGATLVLDIATDPAAFVAQLIGERVSHAVMVPTLVQRLVQSPQVASLDWSALRYIVYGGAPMPLATIEKATQVLGCKFIQSYGLTESTGAVTVLGPEDHLSAGAAEHRLRSVGRPNSASPIRVVDPETLEDVEVGRVGEILIGGPQIMAGYYGDEAATAQAVVDGWLRTGDGGSFDSDGYLYLHDRLKDMIISGGENVYPAEVESVLSGLDGVAEAAVVGIASEKWGESPYAVVVLLPGAALTEADVIAYARARLAHYKCPVGVSFVDSLPRNASGKLLKRVIREQVG
ncbi:AMP-binding protein [Nocardia higoensis]|uniref:AMP-binding protein n=1 Tax=Nocardia higoensis TaxID=228599 RepID=A0ABS0D8C5_9NOCA|nr:AMP-binding protein [Nocardia higoensis]MBF6353023.1 AMP-binding protein [Nocardia higoensis]